MRAVSIELREFRNFQHQIIKLPPGDVLFFGPNGAGKTSVLEALYFIATGTPFKMGTATDLIRIPSLSGRGDFARVAVEVFDEIGTSHLAMSVRNGKKVAERDGVPVRLASEFIGNLPVVSFSTADMRLFLGGPADRRRFVDKHVIDAAPKLFTEYVRYQRSLRQKLMLLKDGGARREIDTWNRMLAETAQPIIESRLRLLSRIGKLVSELYSQHLGSHQTVRLQYRSTLGQQTVEQIYDRLGGVAEREQRAGRTLLGPHLDDVEFFFNDRALKSFASAGEMRCFAFCLKLACARDIEEVSNRKPFLLLDDLVSELDIQRQRGLIEALGTFANQKFVTTPTAEDWLSAGGTGYAQIELKDGRVV